MKTLKYILILFSSFIVASCVDDPILEEKPGEDDNIKEFSDGFSVSFNVMVDDFGGTGTRASINDLQLAEWESYLNPEEFRILFFDDQDRFLFESTTRWLTEVEPKDGNRCWRVGVPIFQYLGDNYDDQGDKDGVPIEQAYNWNEIVRIMRERPFKIAILANRPAKVDIPSMDDWKNSNDPDFNRIAKMGSALNGPFWNAKNSIATDELIRGGESVAEVIDLHHCQFDPLYYYKSINGGRTKPVQGSGYYDFVMAYKPYTGTYIDDNDEPKTWTMNSVPYMGAAASWVSKERSRKVGTRTIQYYRLPIDQVDRQYHFDDIQNNLDVKTDFKPSEDPIQYIPMYGIQRFEALTTWNKGTTYNLSQQVGSQTGNYNYQTIFLLRSVVKLELRIPMFDKAGNYIDIDNKWAQLWYNNYMSRCEPMDVSTSTKDIWSTDHTQCEWTNIKQYGLLADNGSGDFKERLGWYYGIWKDLDLNWDFEGDGMSKDKIKVGNPDNPRIFNPLTQRLQGTLISDCYLPIIPVYETNDDGTPKYDGYGNLIPKKSTQNYHRWVIYCGERNMDDPNYLGEFTNSTLTYFRIHVIKKTLISASSGTHYIYNLPIVDYSKSDIAVTTIRVAGSDEIIQDMESNKFSYVTSMASETKQDNYPLPLLRNHFYRLTVSFGDNDDLNVQVMNSEKRTVGGIEFN